jgi:hypothetical protein
VAATTEVVATVTSVAATFVPPLKKRPLSAAAREPTSLVPRSFSSARASARRARKISVSTAACESCSSSAISL